MKRYSLNILYKICHNYRFTWECHIWDHLRETKMFYVSIHVYDLQNNFGNGLEIVELFSEVASCYFCRSKFWHDSLFFFLNILERKPLSMDSSNQNFLESGYIVRTNIKSIIAQWLFRDGMLIVCYFMQMRILKYRIASTSCFLENFPMAV